MHSVFISYSRKDQEFVKRLANDLNRDKVDNWVDWMDVVPGEEWQKEVDKALDDCNLMLFVISPDSMKSVHVQHELQYFIERRKLIIPLVKEHADVPKELHERQYVDFEDQSYQVAYLQLIAALARHGVEPLDKSGCYSDVEILSQPPLPLCIKDMIDVAKEEIWISGIVLDNLTSQYLEPIERALERGVKCRFMIIKLDESIIAATASWLGCPELRLTFRLLNSALKLCRAGNGVTSPNQCQIKAIPFRPAFGYVIVDPATDEGQMTAAPYLYQIDPIKLKFPRLKEQPPMFYLSKKSTRPSDLHWFSIFQEDFSQLWDIGENWNLDRIE